MLTNLESLRQYLGLSDSDTQNDDLLYEIIKRVSKSVNNRLNRTLEATDYVEYYQGDGTNRLLVRQYPINSIASIYDDVDRQWPANTLKDPTSIVIANQTPGLIQLKGDIFINSAWWSYYNLENLKVSYNAGYVTIPEDVEGAVNKICAVELSKSKGQFAKITSDRDPKALIDEAWVDLGQYQRVR